MWKRALPVRYWIRAKLADGTSNDGLKFQCTRHSPLPRRAGMKERL
jgi:hypothetical protein